MQNHRGLSVSTEEGILGDQMDDFKLMRFFQKEVLSDDYFKNKEPSEEEKE